MSYDSELAHRIKNVLNDANPPGLVEKKMFGGVAYMVQGNLACGVHQNEMIVRVGKEGYMDALNRPGAHPFDLTGRPMSGWLSVRPSGFQTDQALRDWVALGLEFALTLPPK
jgi:TfoX/Sxy family transcriptional regulator of competence genes